MNDSIYTCGYYERDYPEHWFVRRYGMPRPDQLAAFCYALNVPFWGTDGGTPRDPGLIYSIGCGRGELEVHMEQRGYRVIGVDPSPGAQQLYQGSERIDEYPGGGNTILFVEAIEHLEADLIDDIFARIPAGARVIIVNWPDLHPIKAFPAGRDHITNINDSFFDALSVGNQVILRRSSHLVLEMGDTIGRGRVPR